MPWEFALLFLKTDHKIPGIDTLNLSLNIR